MMRFLHSLMLLLLIVTAAHADLLKVERQIILADGKPAVGAKVTLRSLNIKDGTLKQEKHIVADEKGVARGEIEVDRDESMLRVMGYLVVDMDGFALAFENFKNLRIANASPMRLGPGYEVKGKVLTKAGEPIADAEVMLAAFSSNWSDWRINYPSAQIITPEVRTKTAADGSFALRSVDIVEQTFGNGDSAVRPFLIARATKNGTVWTGSSEGYARKPGSNLPENVMRLSSSVAIRGRVIDAVSAKPIGGATVHLRSDPGGNLAATVAPQKSKPDGNFEFSGVPEGFQLFAESTADNFAAGWARVGQSRGQIDGEAPRVYDEVELRLRPLVNVSGRVFDVATNAPPLTPTSISTIYDEGYNDGRIGVGRGGLSTRMKADGTFTMKMPVGPNQIRVRGPGYWEGGREFPIDLDIKAGENRDVKLPVRREKGFLTHFTTNASKGKKDFNYDAEYDLHMRGADRKESSTNWGEWWYWPLYTPTEEREIRVTRFVDGFSQEVVPWTKLTSGNVAPNDPRHWPREVFIPLRQTITVKGKLLDANGKPLPDVAVGLRTRPEIAAKNFPPVKSAADGSFIFERVPLPKEMVVDATFSEEDARRQAFRPGSARVGTGALSAVLTTADEGHQEAKVTLSLRSLVTLKGHLVDAETGGPLLAFPGTSVVLSAPSEVPSLPAEPNASWNNQPLTPWNFNTQAAVAPDGSFAARVPSGELKADLLYWHTMEPGSTIVAVPANGEVDVVLKARKKPGAALRLVKEDPTTFRSLTVYHLDADGKNPVQTGTMKWETGTELLTIVTMSRWGEKKRLKLVDTATRKEVLNEEVVADAQQWPRVITLTPK